jgi:hypothetical protein
MRYQIENDRGFVKDTDTKAVLNVNKDALNAYKLQRKKLTKTFALEDEVNSLKEDIKDIKSLLSQLINNK